MKQAFLSLTVADLRLLRDKLLAGRLGPPYSSASLSDLLPAAQVDIVAQAFQDLSSKGMHPQTFAFMLDVLADERAATAAAGDVVDLVWTGPEAPGIANRDTAVVVRQLFSGAEHFVLVAGYAVYQGRQVFKSLADRMEARPELRVKMFLDIQRPYGDTTDSAELVARFARRFKEHEWPDSRVPEVYYDPRSLEPNAQKKASLHAKCVVLDRQTAFVSSANFTEAAQERNIELGALIRSAAFAGRVVEHFEKLAQVGILVRVAGI